MENEVRKLEFNEGVTAILDIIAKDNGLEDASALINAMIMRLLFEYFSNNDDANDVTVTIN